MCINGYEVCEVDLIKINVLFWKLGSFTIWVQIPIKIDILESKKFTRLQKKIQGHVRGGLGTKSMRPFGGHLYMTYFYKVTLSATVKCWTANFCIHAKGPVIIMN